MAEQSCAFPIGQVARTLKAVAAAGPSSRSAPQRVRWWLRPRGELVAEVSYTVECDRSGALAVWLSYVVRGRPLATAIAVEGQAWRFGGIRWWWRCPWCDGRVGVLYRPAGTVYWRCRSCYRITYQSSNDSHQFDAMDRRLARLLGDSK